MCGRIKLQAISEVQWFPDILVTNIVTCHLLIDHFYLAIDLGKANPLAIVTIGTETLHRLLNSVTINPGSAVFSDAALRAPCRNSNDADVIIE